MVSCLDERSLDLRKALEFSKIVEGHIWELAHFDDFGESGVVVRYSCKRCHKEWTNFLLDPEGVKKLKY
jgi:hypothetical protein